MLLSSSLLRRQSHSQRLFGALFSRSYRRRKAPPPVTAEAQSRWTGYDATLGNLRVSKQTGIVYQVLDEKAKQEITACRKLGTNIYGALRPANQDRDQKGNDKKSITCFHNLENAQTQISPRVLVVNTSSREAPAAITEAMNQQIRLVVVQTEDVSPHEMLRILELLREQSLTRLLGPGSSASIIAPPHDCYIGNASASSCYTPGKIAIISRSASLCHEAALSLREAGLGQNICIGLGNGGIIQGTTMKDALEVVSEDPDTEGILLIGSVGGDMEVNAMKWISTNKETGAKKSVPVVGLIAGRNTPVDHNSIGHLGTFVTSDEADAQAKCELLEKVGVTLVSHPEEVGPVMRKLIPAATHPEDSNSQQDEKEEHVPQEKPEGEKGQKDGKPATDSEEKKTKARGKSSSSPVKRKYHTLRSCFSTSPFRVQQRRSIHYFKPTNSNAFLQNKQLRIVPQPPKDTDVFIGLRIGRFDKVRTLEYHAARHNDMTRAFVDTKTCILPFPRKPAKVNKYSAVVKEVIQALDMRYDKAERIYVATYLHAMQKALRKRECFEIATIAGLNQKKYKPMLEVHAARVGFDETVADRRLQFQRNRNKFEGCEDADETKAKNMAMIYRRFDGDGKIGVLGNSTGQILSSVDNLTRHPNLPTMGCANFINLASNDIFYSPWPFYGALGLLTSDPRVKIIFVNLFHPESAVWSRSFPASPETPECEMVVRNLIEALAMNQETPAASPKKEGDDDDIKPTAFRTQAFLDIPIVLRIKGPGDEKAIELCVKSGRNIQASTKFQTAVDRLIGLHEKT